MAAAGAAFAAGAGLHEIRQGLRTFATSYYLSPGRMNQVNVNNIDVFVDYCHNAPGMRVLGDFVESYSAQKSGQSDLGKLSRLGVIATAGDRRDDDMRELGAIAAAHFDVLVVREDERLRGRRRGECAELVAEGARSRLGEEGCAAARSRSCSTRWRRSTTSWPGRTREMSWCSAWTSTRRSSRSSSS